jgi:nickel-dependent lactate racemase
MRLNLPYGNSSINVELNQGHKAQVLTPHEIPALRYPTHAILEAMENPAGEGLSSIVGRGTNVTIVISDVTRPVPTSLILPPLIRELGRLGVLDEDIRIVTATGLHRGHTDEERAYLVGQEIFRHFKIIDHDARSSTDLTNLGKTSRGTPITVNNTVLDADVRIVISYVAPHPRAGFSGGRKSIIPGVSGEKSIAAIHRPEWMDDPNCVYGMLEGNPMHKDMVEYARIVGVDFTINAVLNSQKQLAGVFAGGLDSAFSEAVRHSRKVNVVQTPRQADVAIVTPGGFPFDCNLYQATKAISSVILLPRPLIRRGGVVVLVCECSEGLGNANLSAFDILMEAKTPADARRTIYETREQPASGQWGVQTWAALLDYATVIIVSDNLAPEVVRKLHAIPASSVEEALGIAQGLVSNVPEVIVLPYAPETIVEVRDS